MADTSQLSNQKLQGKILIVEDDLTFGDWLRNQLMSAGLICHWAKDLPSALSLIEAESFHAMVTDIFLTPGSAKPDGIELVKALKHKGIPVIMMSSMANLQVAKEAVNHGSSYILEKPFKIQELLKVLESIWEEPRGLHALLERFMDIHHLTPKEKEVVRLLVKGLANKEIASIEEITDRTIKAHLTSIFLKCGVTTRTELFNAIFPT